ncbi:MAG: LCP family protein, partial [Firmicutes bacterium]|nr:LCP family protein [Bacillota bacterium]
ENNSLADGMVLNVLIVGLDELERRKGGRSDSNIIISLNARYRKMKIISLMRDIWVEIPGRNFDKLNAAYAIGGIQLAIDVVQKNFGVKIDRYIVVDFKKFEDAIDAIKGIDLNLTQKEVEYINKYSKSSSRLKGSGKMHLNGNQALQFARNRDDPSADFKRTERQRDVISAIIEKFKSMGIAELLSSSKKVMGSMSTNFKIQEIMGLIKVSKDFSDYKIEKYRVPNEYQLKMIDKKSVLTCDLKKEKEALKEFVYETKSFSKSGSDKLDKTSKNETEKNKDK